MLVKKLVAATTATTILLGSDAEDVCNRPMLPGSATGNVVLISAPVADGADTDVVLFLDEVPDGGIPDGVADRVFLLQVARAVDIQDHMTDALVEWQRGMVMVDNGAGRQLRLTTMEPSGTVSVGTLAGYGLAHATGWDAAVPLGQPTNTEYANLIAAVASAGEECKSGGEGAIECVENCGEGRGSCTVKCPENFHACCNCDPPSCRCIPISPGQ